MTCWMSDVKARLGLKAPAWARLWRALTKSQAGPEAKAQARPGHGSAQALA
jgi:hypothetical protein